MLPPEADIDPFGTCILASLPRMLRPPTLSVPLTLPDDAVNDPVKVALPADKLVADTFPEKVALAAVIAFVKEVFGAAGFADGDRFFDFKKAEQAKQNPPQDPAQQLQAQTLQMKQQLDQANIQLKQQELQLKTQEMQGERLGPRTSP